MDLETKTYLRLMQRMALLFMLGGGILLGAALYRCLYGSSQWTFENDSWLLIIVPIAVNALVVAYYTLQRANSWLDATFEWNKKVPRLMEPPSLN
jgi:hypothetical protein